MQGTDILQAILFLSPGPSRLVWWNCCKLGHQLLLLLLVQSVSLRPTLPELIPIVVCSRPSRYLELARDILFFSTNLDTDYCTDIGTSKRAV